MRETQRNEADGSGDPAGPPGLWVSQHIMRAIAEEEREDQVELSLTEDKDEECRDGVTRTLHTLCRHTRVHGGGKVGDVHQDDPPERESAQNVGSNVAGRGGHEDHCIGRVKRRRARSFLRALTCKGTT